VRARVRAGSRKTEIRRKEESVTKTTTVAKIGDQLPDGTVYAGISPDTREPMYTTREDAPLTYTFNQAQKYAAKLKTRGHEDWRMPTKSELNALFQNRAAIGGFNPAGWCRSSTEVDGNYAWEQGFSDGGQIWGSKHTNNQSLRCVRGWPA
jgi:hypothetical protein